MSTRYASVTAILRPSTASTSRTYVEAFQSRQPDTWFRTLLESAPDAMIIVDSAGAVAIVNGQAEKMFGYDKDELVGRPVEELLPTRLRKAHEAHRATYAENPALRSMGDGLDLVARRRDGSEFPVEISLSPVKTADETFVTSVIRDVTERKRMEQAVISSQQAAERANKANSAFLAAASHDLRQPVQALNLLNGALRRTVKDERALEMIDSQEQSLVAMTNLLNSLLDISRLDAGAVSPEFEEFPVRRVIDRLASEFARQSAHKGLSFEAAACDATVRSDPNLLGEIIQNFMSNAIRYTNKGGVKLSCIPGEDYCRIQVEDTGIGIEQDELEEIFREFHQCKSAGGSNEGFGLGLAIVRRLSDLLEHEVTVRSAPGEGSCFAVHVPRVALHSSPAAEDSKTPLETPAATGLIVLIEDDAQVAGAWELLLESEGYQVATAASAREAKAMTRHLSEPPALIVSDYHLLDGATGLDAVAGVREYYQRDIPAFIVTGDTSKVVKEAQPLANCTIMSKPVNTHQLLVATNKAVRTGQVPTE